MCPGSIVLWVRALVWLWTCCCLRPNRYFVLFVELLLMLKWIDFRVLLFEGSLSVNSMLRSYLCPFEWPLDGLSSFEQFKHNIANKGFLFTVCFTLFCLWVELVLLKDLILPGWLLCSWWLFIMVKMRTYRNSIRISGIKNRITIMSRNLCVNMKWTLHSDVRKPEIQLFIEMF